MSKNEPPINTSNDIIVSPIVSRIFLTLFYFITVPRGRWYNSQIHIVVDSEKDQ